MNTQDVVVSDKITVQSARSTVQRPPRKRRRLAKNLFIQDEAEVDDLAEESEQDQSGEDVEDENGLDFEDGTDDETFQTDLSGFREHQSSRVPSLFADVIQRIENSPLERVDTIKVSDFWQDNQIFLQNTLYQHPRAPDVSQRHTVYHVRCRRGYEKRIIRRIQNDIKTFDSRPKQETENRIIEDVHPSKMPGYVYLVIMNTSDLTPLCDYLHSFSSFVYNRPTINRQDSFMPIHHVVTDFHPLAPVAPGCSIGDWVEIKGGDAYAGSLGLVVPNDSRLEYPSENSVTVLTVPRIPRSPLEEESMIATLLGPAAAPLSFESALQISNLYASLNVLHWGKSGTPLWGNSIKSRCHVGSMCPPDHSKELFFRGEIFQCGLIVLVFNHSNLKPAPTSWDSKIVEIFASSHHPHLSYTKMPIPSSWYFEVDEKVHGITGFIPSQYLSIRASIVDVSDLTCEVDFAGEVLTVSKHGLIKSFTGGECVLIPDGGAGTFAMSGEDSSSCIVFYDERTRSMLANQRREELARMSVPSGYAFDTENTDNPEPLTNDGPNCIDPFGSFHPNTLIMASTLRSSSSNSTSVNFSKSPITHIPRIRASIWIGVEVLITKHPSRNGYRGVIRDVHPISSSTSGLVILVAYDVVNIPSEWVDYNQVRNLHTLRYLHDARPNGLTEYYKLKPGFFPLYTEHEKALIIHHARITRSKDNREKDLEKQQEDVRQLLTIDVPSADQWILDPRWQLALGSLEFYIQVHHGVMAHPNDRKVSLAVKNSTIEVRTREGATNTRNRYSVIPTSDICNVPPGGVRTKSVNSRGFDARGLYLVAFGEGSAKRHIGKLVRRVKLNDVGDYFVQRVRVVSKAGRIAFEESLLDDELFEIHYSALLLVHMSKSLNNIGNQLMYNIRILHGGLTRVGDNVVLPSNKDKKKNTVRPTYLESSPYWLGGQTPSHSSNIDD
ncbi:hypothetical protein D9757_012020 [Collybiopsis confluens]|uniref:Uncharacterized protein n=1 Tax=Collybiopsis confluens TaxID=2823264 RepID=A0A8H5LUR6_9AGAR|nr:hypothetical protein D9757_012020 [Collybiopsis confluens]